MMTENKGSDIKIRAAPLIAPFIPTQEEFGRMDPQIVFFVQN
jgi:hypothetical protein